MLSDIELIQQLQNGDHQGLLRLYDKYSAAIYGVLLRMCKREDLAQDILQETFLKIWKKIDRYDAKKGSFYTWSYRIAKNTALNSLRKTSPLIQVDDLSVYDDKGTDEPEDYTDLNGMLNKLEPHHQKAIELVYFMGMTHKEAHETMGVPLGTFKSYIRQALGKLRELYPEVLPLFLFYTELICNG